MRAWPALNLPAARLGVLLLGLALSLWLWSRSQVGGDQLNLLGRGWLLAAEGHLVPCGNPLSSGGNAPGAVTSLLVGLPLLVWRHHRASALLVPLFHLVGFLLLDRALSRLVSPRERLLFAVLYWLGPWRVCFSGFLWNPNYLFLAGAVHLATAAAERNGPRWPAAAVHAATVVMAVQVHPSGVILGLASLLLLWRGYWRPSWPGLVTGALLGALPLLPWAVAVAAQPELLAATTEKGFLGRGLLLVTPLLKGLLLWLRYPCLALPGRMLDLDFGWATPALRRAVGQVLGAVLPLSALVPLAANVWLARAAGRRLLRPLRPGVSGRAWLRGYAFWCLVGAAIGFAASPTTPMVWQALVVLHASVLPVALWAGALARTRRAALVGILTIAYGIAATAIVVVVGLGARDYTCRPGPSRAALGYGFPLAADHPMLHELGIDATCPWPVGAAGDWWPDALPSPTPVVERGATRAPRHHD